MLNAAGEIIEELIFPYGYPILPRTSHTYYRFWKDDEILSGTYTAICNVQYGETYNMDKLDQAQTSFSIK